MLNKTLTIELPRSTGSRVFCAVLSLCTSVATGILLHVFLRSPMSSSPTIGEIVAFGLIAELVVGAFVVSTLAFVWATVMPEWLEALLNRKAWLLVGAFALTLITVAVTVLVWGP